MSDEDYIIHSTFKRAPIIFVLTSGKLSGMCTPKHYVILYELLNEIYNVTSIYTYDELTNIVSVCSNQSLDPFSNWKAFHAQYISYPIVWPRVENGFGVENGFFIGDWIFINLFEFVWSVGWKVRKKISVLANIGSELFISV